MALSQALTAALLTRWYEMIEALIGFCESNILKVNKLNRLIFTQYFNIKFVLLGLQPDTNYLSHSKTEIVKSTMV
jgi:hypothetical protein